MTKSNFMPVFLQPTFKDYLWGGTKLKESFNKKTELEKVAESWELSTHRDGQSTVSSGEYSGLTLSEYLEKIGKDALGENAAKFEFFPILIKLIDASDNLSVQVHPSDEYALKNEGEYGKTEMWYVTDCDEGAFLYFGLNREITKEELKRRIENNTLLEVLNKVEVHKGDVFFIPSGTVHAICKGIMVCEIQQNSNTTYRVYDYDRRDKNGNARELHIQKAIDVCNLKPNEPNDYSQDNVLAKCKYFTVEKINCKDVSKIKLSKSCFRSVVCVSGEGILSLGENELHFKKGDSIFIPAQNGECTVRGNSELIVSYV